MFVYFHSAPSVQALLKTITSFFVDMTMLRFLTKKGLYLDATVERFLDVKLQLVGTMS